MSRLCWLCIRNAVIALIVVETFVLIAHPGPIVALILGLILGYASQILADVQAGDR